MATLTILLPDDKHLRLKKLAESQGLSINKLIEELLAIALVEFDTHTRFKLLAAQSDRAAGLKLLDKLPTEDQPLPKCT
jgi:hypothetical protein